MIEVPKYRKRSHEFLLRASKKARNLLEMRDWEINLETGDTPPKRFIDSDNGEAIARADLYTSCRKAYIWVSDKRAKKANEDPLFCLYHELAHCILDVPDEELKCNIIARFLL